MEVGVLREGVGKAGVRVRTAEGGPCRVCVHARIVGGIAVEVSVDSADAMFVVDGG